MKFSLINIPYALNYAAGNETATQVIDWDLQVTKWADEYGLDEVFFAEHYTLGAEPSPAPDLMIAAASQLTSKVKLGALGHLLPYHNPIALAFRMMWLDHMTEGRYIAGVAPGPYPSDAALFGTKKNNPKMMAEALDIIEIIWANKGPQKYEGEFFSVDLPAYSSSIHGPHLRPYQDAPPMLMTGMQASSPTLTECGRRNFEPVSQLVSTTTLKAHWAAYAEAATAAGHTPSRNKWRVVRSTFVADSDEQALDQYMRGPSAKLWTEHNLPTFRRLGLGSLLTDGAVADEDITVEWLAENLFFVGSPETVAGKISHLFDEVGGFGALIAGGEDYKNNPEPYRRSLELIGTKVAPMVSHLTVDEDK
ncbi:LLM class flavin-dependent oxidoreductase [Rhodococcus fascians]|nr:LLM class flavin-dependent oxidoreductase [Rhodococcus fascians]MBY4238034.1 LLM class flavin-dependent oxidoreductase [Rhodococcus fascians]MBY4253215.1 LLM class flavin-dependent oxidoreductase [Rhodococcus fascians]MBY4268852.1 LLM class flavin-dependent oxidoreductase [Rhodococcus fascians]